MFGWVRMMQVESPGMEEGNVARPGISGPYRILTTITPALVLLQAALAGQGWFEGDADFIRVHEVVANLFVLVVVAQVVMTVAVGIRGPLLRQLVLTNGLLLLLTLVQMGLGYLGRETNQAAAWHVPNGVLLFGLAVAIATLALRLKDD